MFLIKIDPLGLLSDNNLFQFIYLIIFILTYTPRR